MEGVVKRGISLLDALKLREAEEEFLSVLKFLWHPDPNDKNLISYDKTFDKDERFRSEIECLMGIAECRIKSLKMGLCCEEESWYHFLLYPLFLLHTCLHRCVTYDDADNDKVVTAQQRALKLTYQIKNIEKQFINKLCAKVFPPRNDFENHERENLKTSKQNVSAEMRQNLTFLQKLIIRCAKNDGRLEESNHMINRTSTKEVVMKERLNSGNVKRECHPSSQARSLSQPPSKNKGDVVEFSKNRSNTSDLNFEKFQESIQNYVKDVSKEIKSIYGHLSKVPRDKITNRIASELILRLDSSPSEFDALHTTLISPPQHKQTTEVCKSPVDDNISQSIKNKLKCLEEDDNGWRGRFYEDDEDDDDGDDDDTFNNEDEGNDDDDGDQQMNDSPMENSQSGYYCINSFCTSDDSITFRRSNRVVLLWCNEKNKNMQTDKILNTPHTPSKQYSSFLSDLKELSDVDTKDLMTGAGDKTSKSDLLARNNAKSDSSSNRASKSEHEMAGNTGFKCSDRDMLEIICTLIMRASDDQAVKKQPKNALVLLEFLENMMNVIENKFKNEGERVKGINRTCKSLWERLGERYSERGRVALGCDYLQKCFFENNNITEKNHFRKKTFEYQKAEIDYFDRSAKACEESIAKVRILKKLAEASVGKEIRNESLTFKFMLLVKQEIKKNQNPDNSLNLHSLAQTTPHNVDETSSDSYLVCLHEAITHLTQALHLLPTHPCPPELWCEVLVMLADCQVMAGNFALAETFYDEVLKKLPKTVAGGQLRSNCHVILSLASLSFLSHNLVRTKTLLHTVLVMRGDSHVSINKDFSHQHSSIEEFSQVWILTLISLCHTSNPYEAIPWLDRSIRAFEAFFDGFSHVDPLNSWYISHLLTILSHYLLTTSQPQAALCRLIVLKNFLDASAKVDSTQMCSVWRMLADACRLLSLGAGPEEDQSEVKRQEWSMKSGSCGQMAVECMGGDVRCGDGLFREIQQLNTMMTMTSAGKMM